MMLSSFHAISTFVSHISNELTFPAIALLMLLANSATPPKEGYIFLYDTDQIIQE